LRFSTAVSYTMPTAPSHLNAILIQPRPTCEPYAVHRNGRQACSSLRVRDSPPSHTATDSSKSAPRLVSHAYLIILFRLPTCAEKPVLMAVTDRREPHELQVTK